MDDFRTEARGFLTEHFDAWKRNERVDGDDFTFECKRRQGS